MSQLKGLFLIMHVGLIPTYLTDNIDNETIKETIFYLGNLANLSTFEHLLMVHTGKVKKSWKGLTNALKTDKVDIKPLPDELQFVHDFFESIFCHNKFEE